MLGVIPSPPSDAVPVLGVRYYGLMIALGVLAAVWLARRRFARRGIDPDLMADIAVWAVPAGLIGARLYHVVTDYGTRYCGEPDCTGSLFPDAFAIWNGGLGIPGGILAGVVVGLLAGRHYGVPLRPGLDAVAPALPLAQAIGRLGNWFNQELFGRPTDLPWGLRIDNPAVLGNLPPQYRGETVFHPTFLYEGLWNIGLMFLLIRLDAPRRLKAGGVFWLYVFGYGLGRLWVEGLRIDEATELAGIRVNIWMSLAIMVVALVGLVRGGAFRSAEDRAAALAVTPWTGDVGSAATPAGSTGSAESPEGAAGAEGASEAGELGEDDVAEGGPQDARPGPEVDVAETHEGEAGVGVDPDEGA